MNTITKPKNLIREIVDKIVTDYSPLKIILFGSYAYGEPDEDSDIDLMILKNTDKMPIERWMELKKLLRDYSKNYAISPLVYTEAELQNRISLKDFFIQEIMEKGKILYG